MFTYIVLLSENEEFKVEWTVSIALNCSIEGEDLPKRAYSSAMIYAFSDIGLVLGTLLGHLSEISAVRGGSMRGWN